MSLKESKAMNFILIVAVVILLLASWLNHPASFYFNLFISIGLIGVSTVLYFKWMPLVGNANPCVSGNVLNFLKMMVLVVFQVWTLHAVSKCSSIGAALLLGLCVYLWMNALPIFQDSVDNGLSTTFRHSLKLGVAMAWAVLFFLSLWLKSFDFHDKPFSAYLLGFAVAIVLFVMGYMCDRSWSSLFYSIGFVVLVAVMTFNWVPMSGWLCPHGPKNNAIICKLILSVIVQLVALYWVSRNYPLLGALIFCLSLFGWRQVAPFEHVDSDPAGGGMAAGFRMMMNFFLSFLFSVIFLLLIKYVKSNAVLPICMVLFVCYVLFAAIGDYRSRAAKEAERCIEYNSGSMEIPDSSDGNVVPTHKEKHNSSKE